VTPHLARFARQPGASKQVMGTYHPYGTADTPMVMPMHLVQVGPDGIAYQDMQPITAPDGRMIPATAPHRWFQLYMAGRP
jgi:hypothetical protein